ncbi:FxSxx-COOH system tetratricopeptide repeat protein (plasmid) [Streptomyces sp. NBC_01213]|uniref:FxSxx-COOH system tetratricopeptide repeat protein n=1 Tax=Streptomyces sp. NBC_01213 TaxID=2903776 RepID=UPI002F91B633|nr:FxSxx-COOH system tetratricopeptide repeat protein [Streptomyces sp. NBC_01213]
MTPRWPRRRDNEATEPAALPDTAPEARRDSQQQVRVSARSGGIAAGGDASHNAFGSGSRVVDNRQTHIHHAPREVAWPLEVGTVPGLASAFQPRSALRNEVDTARARGSAAVLTQVLSGGGGVGKSQLAAAYASEALHDGTDLVLWASAVEIQQVVTLYAQAAVRVAAPGALGNDSERDARALLAWLATTNRRWLVVLDNITDPTGIARWWPASRTGTGWVLGTTRLHDASLTGNGRRRIRVDVYTPDEASAYLGARLTDDGAERLLDDAVDDLAQALGYLPLALGHAAAYMLNQDLTCAQYLARFNDDSRPLDQLLPETADAEGYGRQIATTLLLSLDAAQRTGPAGLARPALQLAAHLDPAGHPHALWNTPTVLAYLTEHRTPVPDAAGHRPEPVAAEESEAVLRVLHRYALITSDRRQEPRAVRVHALTARAVRETTATETLPLLARAAADALLHVWPDLDQPHPALAATLRTNTDHLHQHTDSQLWHPDGHEVLYRAGNSLLGAGLASAATAYWERLSDYSQQILGPDHPRALSARCNLARSYQWAGRTTEAIALQDSVLADLERLSGPDHPETLTARSALANSYGQAGRTTDALMLQESVLADLERVLGPDHPHTLTTRNNLANSYGQAGRTTDALKLQESVLVDSERILGPDHPDTTSTRNNLANSYGQAGRITEALILRETVLVDSERILGPDHPHTLTARSNLAHSLRQAGRDTEATILEEAVFRAQERISGPDHPDTLTIRHNLANAYGHAGRTTEAISLHEAVLADRARILGPEHPNTLNSRNSLANYYGHAGRTTEAISLHEAVLADRARILGPEHPNTLNSRNSLANYYGQAGRTTEAITLHEAVLATRTRILGPEHPDTTTTRNNLAFFYGQARRTTEAITLLEAATPDSERILGPDHPETLNARNNLAVVYCQAGRTTEAITLLEAVTSDRERILGPDHPETLKTRNNLAAAYRQAGP